MGSLRLPGKSLAPIEGRTILAHCIERLRHRSGLRVIVATTTAADDDVLATEARRLNVPVVRGAVDDVLARFVMAAGAFDLTAVVRATADNPAVDMDAPRRTLDLLQRTDAAHVVEHGLPYGAAVEAVSVAALRVADAEATEASDREHVTPFIKRERRFLSLDALAPAHVRCAELRLTVDTPEDLEFVRRVYAFSAPSGGPAPLRDLISAAALVADITGASGTGGQ
jgi:spore coat polysaccharide biosynthesis protein SpsF (cytidylyltransferase family)